MVKLRLKRIGRKQEPHYRIVATDSRSPRDGRFIEEIGWFNPKAKDILYKIDVECAKKWLKNGAQPSDTVKGILIKEGLIKKDGKEFIEKNTKGKVKNAEKRRKHKKAVKTDGEATA